MSDSSNNSNRKSNSDRNISSGQVIWYILLGGMLVLLIGAFVVNNSGYRLEYSDFVRLVEATKYSQPGSTNLVEGFEGKIVISSKTKNETKIELSNLKNIQMSNDLITGKVQYRLIKPDS
ncbi:MAG: hypothetical protein J0M26_18675, partial [Planctomycetes bacterium]|nr:hypothetical protein [Planctomycetota bacterium]